MTRSNLLATTPVLEAAGRHALARLGARLSAVYFAGTAIGVWAAAQSAPGRPAWAGLPVACQVLLFGALISVALSSSASPGAAGTGPDPAGPAAPQPPPPVMLRLVVLGAGLVVVVRIVAAGPLIGWSHVHFLIGWVVPAVGLGLALAGGPAWGTTGFVVLGAGFWWVVPDAAAAAVPATLAGSAVTVAVAAAINVFARQGFATTESTLRAAEAAEAARRRAEHLLLARRRLDRVLHDTVLSTLTVLAHGARGIPADQVRADCRRDLAALRSDRWTLADDGSAAPPAATGVVPRAGRVPRQGAPIAERLDAVRKLAAREGIDLRVHVQAEGRPFGPGAQDAAALEAWSSALTECVTNITRHAGVAAADIVLGRTDSALVTLVVDEGSGFEPASVRPERLGLSGSVRERLHDVGGQARVWSRPGEGTVVELVLPWPRNGETSPP